MTEKLKGLQNEHLLMKKNAQHLEATVFIFLKIC